MSGYVTESLIVRVTTVESYMRIESIPSARSPQLAYVPGPFNVHIAIAPSPAQAPITMAAAIATGASAAALGTLNNAGSCARYCGVADEILELSVVSN